MASSGEGGPLPLDGLFALNPNMPTLKAFYDAKQALMLHAVATPYRERSHFDGQDVLENGTPSPRGAESGWLNRAATVIPAGAAAYGRGLIALGPTVPLIMRGRAPVVTWSTGGMKRARADTVIRLARLYERDPELLSALTEGEKIDDFFARSGMVRDDGRRGPGRIFSMLAAAAGRALAKPDGPRIAALALDGWDTHADEGPAAGRLGKLLAAFDESIGTLRTELGDAWNETVVVAATEFGRTVRENGTTGTDHGTAAAAFLAGGAVKGGRVVADWPGLRPAALFEGRDLRPTTDLRAVIKGVLHDHMQMPEGLLATAVFPESKAVKPMSGLVA
jgi:uncharacterized protein (DUF1501 family)